MGGILVLIALVGFLVLLGYLNYRWSRRQGEEMADELGSALPAEKPAEHPPEENRKTGNSP